MPRPGQVCVPPDAEGEAQLLHDTLWLLLERLGIVSAFASFRGKSRQTKFLVEMARRTAKDELLVRRDGISKPRKDLDDDIPF